MSLTEKSERIRAFIAADISPESLSGIERLQGELKDTIRGVRWVKSEGLHLTLKFLGGVKEEEVEKLGDILRPLCASHPPMDLTVGGLGAFPDLRQPRVIWLGVEGEVERLIELQRDVEKGCASLGFPEEKRGFTPHLTLGRVKEKRRDIGYLADVMRQADVSRFKPFRVDNLHIYRSELKPAGAVYTKLKTFPLKGDYKKGHKLEIYC